MKTRIVQYAYIARYRHTTRDHNAILISRITNLAGEVEFKYGFINMNDDLRGVDLKVGDKIVFTGRLLRNKKKIRVRDFKLIEVRNRERR